LGTEGVTAIGLIGAVLLLFLLALFAFICWAVCSQNRWPLIYVLGNMINNSIMAIGFGCRRCFQSIPQLIRNGRDRILFFILAWTIRKVLQNMGFYGRPAARPLHQRFLSPRKEQKKEEKDIESGIPAFPRNNFERSQPPNYSSLFNRTPLPRPRIYPHLSVLLQSNGLFRSLSDPNLSVSLSHNSSPSLEPKVSPVPLTKIKLETTVKDFSTPVNSTSKTPLANTSPLPSRFKRRVLPIGSSTPWSPAWRIPPTPHTFFDNLLEENSENSSDGEENQNQPSAMINSNGDDFQLPPTQKVTFDDGQTFDLDPELARYFPAAQKKLDFETSTGSLEAVGVDQSLLVNNSSYYRLTADVVTPSSSLSTTYSLASIHLNHPIPSTPPLIPNSSNFPTLIPSPFLTPSHNSLDPATLIPLSNWSFSSGSEINYNSTSNSSGSLLSQNFTSNLSFGHLNIFDNKIDLSRLAKAEIFGNRNPPLTRTTSVPNLASFSANRQNNSSLPRNFKLNSPLKIVKKKNWDGAIDPKNVLESRLRKKCSKKGCVRKCICDV
jgi:hypothetical protein